MKNTGNLKVEMTGDRAVTMTRVFNAPRQLVWDAFSKPELLKRWFGPRGYSLSVCEVDHRVGGTWRFVILTPEARKSAGAPSTRSSRRGSDPSTPSPSTTSPASRSSPPC
jgi:hypothetical protein